MERPTEKPTMSDAEFKVRRERMGLTGDKLSEILAVADRTGRKWETGAVPVNPGAATELRDLHEQAITEAQYLAETLPEGETLRTYRTDADYERAHPDSPWSAGWHRAICGRVIELRPDITITY